MSRPNWQARLPAGQAGNCRFVSCPFCQVTHWLSRSLEGPVKSSFVTPLAIRPGCLYPERCLPPLQRRLARRWPAATLRQPPARLPCQRLPGALPGADHRCGPCLPRRWSRPPEKNPTQPRLRGLPWLPLAGALQRVLLPKRPAHRRQNRPGKTQARGRGVALTMRCSSSATVI